MQKFTAALLLASLSACATEAGEAVNAAEAPSCATEPHMFVDQDWFVFFDASSSKLSRRIRVILGELASRWRRDGGNLVKVRSHADAQEAGASNPALSRQWADAVKLGLVAGGVSAGRVTTQFFGASRSLVPSDQAEPQSRFVELFPIFTH